MVLRTLQAAMLTAVEAMGDVNTLAPGTEIRSVTIAGSNVRVSLMVPGKGRFIDTYIVENGQVVWVSLEEVN